MKISWNSFRFAGLVLVWSCMIAGTVVAQDDNRRGGGRGGFGGRGPQGGMGDPTLGLLRMTEVRTELKISPEQETAITKLVEGIRPSRPEGVDFGSMSEEKRTEFFEKMRKEMETKVNEAKEQLEEVLFPNQIDRLKEISLQAQGAQALGNEEVAKSLNITDAQKKELEEVRESLRVDMQSKMQEAFANRGNAGAGGDMREVFTQMRKDMDEKVFAVLTAEQKAEFEKMKGEKFDLPEGATGFGGGRGGDRGDRGGRGGDRGGRRGGGDQPESSDSNE